MIPTAPAAPSPSAASREDVDAAASRFYDALQDLLWVYQFRDRDHACYDDISVTECYSLEAIEREGPRTVNQLASLLYLDKSCASRVATSLERKGYLRRRTHPEDARALQLELTPEGEALHSRIRRDIEQRHRELLADYPPEVREAARDLLRRLARQGARTACGRKP